ncbi:MAG: alpha/beta fold hydrolase [Bacteroidota bacterium]
MHKLRKIGKILLIFFVLLLTMLYFLQEKLIFLPTNLPSDHVYSFDVPFEEIFLEAKDGAQLNAIHFKQDNPAGVILYFHGNAGDLQRWGGITTFFAQWSYDVIVMDYRTYGKSTGKLSEQALHGDAQLFYEYALERYTNDDIIVYGRSLGTGIATYLSANNKPAQLILETPYFSLLDVAKERFPFLPLKWMMKYHFLSYKHIQGVQCPITIFHGTEDDIVPYESGKRLYESISGKQAEMYTIEGGAHNNLINFDTYQEGIDKILDQSKSPEDK